jgi:hypothetical protein
MIENEGLISRIEGLDVDHDDILSFTDRMETESDTSIYEFRRILLLRYPMNRTYQKKKISLF